MEATPTPLRAAMEAYDHAAVVDDAVLRSPIFDKPFTGLAAFLGSTGPKLGRRRVGGGRAALLPVANAPLTFFMRRTAASGPGLLRLKTRRS